MKGMRTYTQNFYRDSLKRVTQMVSNTNVAGRYRPSFAAENLTENPKEEADEVVWPRRIFSGIQPTGSMHLGNYLGAVQKWAKLQDGKENVTYCIVDMHSITVPQDPLFLRENILEIAATMLACGIDPAKSNVFVQSAVKEHAELCWILSCLSTMARVSHLPQYKEKSKKLKEVPMGLFAYPVLQAADIMLYKSTDVPVGEDQVQHIQLAKHLARTFNQKFGVTFPICNAIIENNNSARLRSLRHPIRKMSKSDPDPRATIFLRDEPDVIVDKIKKAVTDFTSDVTYDPEKRLGVSNLITIHSMVSGQSVSQICEEAKTIDTGTYKLRVADAVVEHLNPIRNKIKEHLTRRRELIYFLEMGAEKARQVAQQTMAEVKDKIGLGTENYRTMADIKINLSMAINDIKAAAPPEDFESCENVTNLPSREKPIERIKDKNDNSVKGVKVPEEIEL